MVVGRDEGAGITIPDERVSRRHATLEPAAGRWWYRDAGSRNGSFLDGRRVTELLLTSAVTIRVGAVDGPELRLDPGLVAGVRVGDAEAIGPASRLGRLSLVHELGAETIRIGRTPDNDVVVDDLRVSRHHAELRRSGSVAELFDLGSQNGTWVNGLQIQRAVLEHGDLVGIGGLTLRFVSGRLEAYESAGAAWLAAVDLAVQLPDGRRLLDGISFALEPSSLLAVAGPSGAGKTTLLNALTGVRPATSGTVLYAGRDVYANFGDLRQRMGFVPQDDILHPQLTVRQALGYAAELRFPGDVPAPVRNARVTEVMEELGLAERADLPISRLSGGQRKRTSVGVELLSRPSLLFLDEPTSGLDPANEANLLDLLESLAHGGRTIVLVTHSLASMERADRLLLLAPGGRTAFYGPPAEVTPYFTRVGEIRGLDRVFARLESDRTTDWAGSYAADEIHTRFVTAPLRDAGPGRAHDIAPVTPPPPPTAWLRQLGVLARRYLAVIRADRGVLILLTAQAPVFAVLFVALFSGRTLFSTGTALNTSILIWMLALGATWLGTSNAIREIVKESPIYRRERAIGLAPSAYLASKVIVLGAITTIQALVLVVIAMYPHELPATNTPAMEGAIRGLALAADFDAPRVSFEAAGALLRSQQAELAIGAVLTALAAMTIALFVSAIARTVDRAATVLPLLLIVNTVASAPMFQQPPLGLRELGYVSTAQWGIGAMGATVDLNHVREYFVISQDYTDKAAAQGEAFDPTDYAPPDPIGRPNWEHAPGPWLTNVLAMFLLGGSALVGSWAVLRGLAIRNPVRRWRDGTG